MAQKDPERGRAHQREAPFAPPWVSASLQHVLGLDNAYVMDGLLSAMKGGDTCNREGDWSAKWRL
jgi:hypothetical protein